jgi:hypothetical protein
MDPATKLVIPPKPPKPLIELPVKSNNPLKPFVILIMALSSITVSNIPSKDAFTLLEAASQLSAYISCCFYKEPEALFALSTFS